MYKFSCSEVELAYVYESATRVLQLYTSTPTLLNGLTAPVKPPSIYIQSIILHINSTRFHELALILT